MQLKDSLPTLQPSLITMCGLHNTINGNSYLSIQRLAEDGWL